jgi:hypothetical protein
VFDATQTRETMTKRVCKAKTKKGKPCGANPLKPGTVIEGTTVTGKWCRQHDEDLPASARIGGAQPGSGRPRTPRAVDVLKERIEQDIDKVLRPLWDALVAERAVVVGNGPTAYVESVTDHPTRIAAVRELLDRGYGRSKQSSEVTVITEDMLDRALQELEAQLAGNDSARPEHRPGEAPAVPQAEGASS